MAGVAAAHAGPTLPADDPARRSATPRSRAGVSTGGPACLDRATTTIVDAEVDGVVRRRADRARTARRHGTGPAAHRAHGVVRRRRGALLPGLHDHHLHLLAMAAGRPLGRRGRRAPTRTRSTRALRAAHDGAAPRGWLRVVGYDERHGPLDRLPPRPPRAGSSACGCSTAPGRPGCSAAPAWHAVGASTAPTAGSTGPTTELGRRWPGEVATRPGARSAASSPPWASPASPTPHRSPTPAGSPCSPPPGREATCPSGSPSPARPCWPAPPIPAGLEQGPVKVVVADDALPVPDDLAAAVPPPPARPAERSRCTA